MSSARRVKACKDCGSTTRKLSSPGPRCATCHRVKRKEDKERAHGRWIYRTYGITKDQYTELLAYQGGSCYICQRAFGKSKRLAVDHDHKSGYVRGLLCSVCNNILGHFRDDDMAFQRGGFYLRHPPAYRVIGKVKPNGTE